MVSGKHGIEEKTVYPYSVDVPADPERRYVFTIHSIAKLACAVLFVAMIAAIAIAMHERSRSADPIVIYWDEHDSRFGGLLPSNGSPYSPRAEVDERHFIEEYFLRTYMMRIFAPAGDSDWCDCRSNSRPGLFDFNRGCFICNFSAPDVFQEANSTLRNVKFGDFRINRVELLDTNTIQPKRSLISRILGGTEQPGRTTSIFRVDFSLGLSSLSAYYTITSPDPNPRYSFRVESANYVFDPNGDSI
jgi:hypothetical protein